MGHWGSPAPCGLGHLPRGSPTLPAASGSGSFPGGHLRPHQPWGPSPGVTCPLAPCSLGLLPRGSLAPPPQPWAPYLGVTCTPRMDDRPPGVLPPGDATPSPAWSSGQSGPLNPGTQPGGAAKTAVPATCHSVCVCVCVCECVSPRQVHGPPTWAPRTLRGRGPHRDTTELPPSRCR